MKQIIIFWTCLYDAVVHPLQITLDGGNRGFYLMAQVRKEVGTDFLLMTEVFIESIDGAYEGSKLVFFPVFYLFVGLTGNDIRKILYNGLDRSERSAYPES